MTADADIQIWLETLAHVQPSVIVPYVSSSTDRTLSYQLHTLNQGPQGRSEMSQGGMVNVTANVPVALSRMSLSRTKNDQCKIDVVLSEKGHADRAYHFDCPR